MTDDGTGRRNVEDARPRQLCDDADVYADYITEGDDGKAAPLTCSFLWSCRESNPVQKPGDLRKR